MIYETSLKQILHNRIKPEYFTITVTERDFLNQVQDPLFLKLNKDHITLYDSSEILRDCVILKRIHPQIGIDELIAYLKQKDITCKNTLH